jgi:hypothetical protein
VKTAVIAVVAFSLGWMTAVLEGLFGSKFMSHDKLVAKYGPPASEGSTSW